jgi:putative ABC transport system permease protein
MNLSVAARLAGRELRGGLRGFRILIACLALGVAAIAGVGSVRSAIEAGLAQEGSALLGGDAQMSFTYRFATPEELAWMEETATAVSEVADFRSMAVAGTGEGAERGLTQVKAVDDAYPLVGTVRLSPEMPLSEAFAGRDGLPGAVMAPLLVDRLGLAPGDRFRLGTADFVLMARLETEPDAGAAGFSLGPRTIVLRDAPRGLGPARARLALRQRLPAAPARGRRPRRPEGRGGGAIPGLRPALAGRAQRRPRHPAVRRPPRRLPDPRGPVGPRRRRRRRRGLGPRLPRRQDLGHRHAPHPRGRAFHHLRDLLPSRSARSRSSAS